MGFSTLFIRRPIATALLMVAVLLLGVLGYRELPVSALPEIEAPSLVVTTQYPGASASTMASLVTTPLERNLGQISGLDMMTSDSSAGLSTIVLQFNMDRDIDIAAQDVQAAINQARGTLPSTLPYPPVYNRVNPADAPIMTLMLTSDSRQLRDVNDLADSILAQKLSQVQGVGLVSIAGNVRPAVRIQVNPAQLANLGLTMEDVRNALTEANVNAPKGTLNGATQSYTISTNDQLATAAEYKNTIISYNSTTNAPVRLSDVAKVVDGVENDQLAAWANGKPAVLLDIRRQPGANIVQTVAQIRQILPQLRSVLPADVHLDIFADRTITIRASVEDVQFTLLLTIALVVAVIFVFLRRLWATIIPSVAVPLSLLGTFGVMSFAGMSLDNLSLMALTVATGFVVDDAIVMIENIVRYIEQGKDGQGSRRNRREGNRLHRVVADCVADRRVPAAAVDARRHRSTVPRIRLGARHRRRHLDAGVADAHADDVRVPAEARRAAGRRRCARAPRRSRQAHRVGAHGGCVRKLAGLGARSSAPDDRWLRSSLSRSRFSCTS